MTMIVSRQIQQGHLTVEQVDTRLRAACDGVRVPPLGSTESTIEAIGEVRGSDGERLRKALAGKPYTHILQGNIPLLPDEAAACRQALANARQLVRDRLEAAVPGLGEWEVAAGTRERAYYAYEAARERGYPPREAAALRSAEDVLDGVYARHPKTRAWATILSYCHAADDRKLSAGHEARKAVEAGADPVVEAEKMQERWSGAINRMIDAGL